MPVSVGKNAIASGAQAAATALLLFLTYRYLLRELTPEQFGLWALLVAVAGVARLADFGLGAAAARFVAADLGAGAHDRAAAVLQTLVVVAALGSGAVAVTAWLLAPTYLPWLVPAAALPASHALLPYMLASLALQIVGSALLGGLEGAQRYGLRAAVVVGGYALLLTGCILLVPRFGLVGVGLAQVVQAASLALVAWLLVRHALRMRDLLPLRASWAELRRVGTFSGGFQLIAISQIAVELLVKTVLSRFAGLAATGLFEVAQRITQQLRAPLVGACQVLLPAVASKQGGDARIAPLYARAAGLLTLLAATAFSGLQIAFPLLTVFLLGSFDELLWSMTALLGVAWLLNTLSVPSYYALLGLGTTRWHVLGHVLILVVTAVLAPPLGASFGVLGIVAAYGLALVVGAAVVVIVFHRRLRLPYSSAAGVWPVVLAGVGGSWLALALARAASMPVLASVTALLLGILAAVAWQAWRRHDVRWPLRRAGA